MTSQDNAVYVTVETFNDGIARIERRLDRIDNTLAGIQTEIRAMDRRVEINTVKIDELHYFMGIGFAVMAVVVAFVGFVITLAPMFRDMYHDRKQANSERVKQDVLDTVRGEMRSMIDEAISRALGAKKQQQ